MKRVTVVTVAFGAEPWLERSVSASLASTGVDVDVVLVDNGCTDGAVDRLAALDRVTVVSPGENLGFADGCNRGVEAATGELVALVNPDAIVEPAALAALAQAVGRERVGIATASVRLADRPDRLNSAGNAIHFTGLSWSGSFDEQASAHAVERDAAAASGAGMLLRRSTWLDLGGFAPEFFAYYEDADLSLRAWQAGLRVVFVPDAVVHHRYEFSRNTEKMFLLERNRALMVLGCYSTRLLLVLLPVLLLMEAATLAAGFAQGWWREKLRSWGWLFVHRDVVLRRRRTIQAARSRPDRDLVPLFAARLAPGNLPPPRWFGPIDVALRAYWAVAGRLV